MQVAVTFPSDPDTRFPMTFGKQIGQGKFKVYLVKSTALDTQYALKVFSRDFILRYHFDREKMAMLKLDHPNIVKHVPINSHNFRMDIMLTEYLPNGDMFDFLVKGHLEDEKLMRTYFHQLINGLEHVHSQGIAHLDMKLDNLLLDANYNLKIIDFDQAQSTTEQHVSQGTTGYRAPEVRNGTCKDLLAVDIYATGIILFAFKACEFPFTESDDRQIKEVQRYSQFVEKNDEFWAEKAESKGDSNFFSPEFKDLVNGMLREDPTQRLTIEQIKNSEWYKGPVYEREELKDAAEQSIAAVSNRSQK